ncbi:PorT family protein [Neolewinella aurantiaca]|uniref:PorT family protein n=1 Tax=Neolewinella aurantiaca TaxID=2602767 RepID=A0A5C7F8V0_9BACT|nr:porin family protein [Neolewinella aurantiaca]TXF86020.1 PorT family protein [Neolewinella aurantiaca]
MRTLLTTLVFALLGTFVYAQTETTPAGVSFGLRAGYGSSNIRTDSEFDAVSDQFDNTSALSFGAFADIPFGNVVSFRPGIEINRRGTVLNIAADQEVFGINVPLGAQAKTRFTYVDVPLLVQAKLPTTGAVQPYAFAGASLGYATGGNLRTTATAIIEFNLMSSDIDLDAINYERFHVAAVGGAGAKFSLAPGFGAFVEGRFEQSLTEPYDVPLATAKTGFKGLNFGAGVTFSL